MGLIGGGLAIIGCMIGANFLTVILVKWAFVDAGLDAVTMQSINKVLESDSFQSAFIMFPVPGLALMLGFIVLGLGLYRTKVVARWVAVLLVLAGPLFLLGQSGDIWSASLTSHIDFFFVMGTIGKQILRWTVEQWEKVPKFEHTRISAGSNSVVDG